MIELGSKNAKDLDAPWVHVFLYGPTGSGKSTAASTFPKPFFIQPRNEGSIVTLAKKDINYFEVVDMNRTPLRDGVGSMVHALDRLEAVYRQDPDNCPFDTIVIESLTHYADLVIEQLTEGGKKQMTQFEWGLLTSHLRNIQTRLRNMQVHAVFTALDKTDTAEDNTVIGTPLIQGQSAVKLPSACDLIGYCEEFGGKNNMVHRVHFRRYKHFVARTRFPTVPPMIENFAFEKIAPHLL